MQYTQKTAVVAVTYNRKDLIIKSLEGIFAQTQNIDKVFLVDNASTDGTLDALTERYGISDKLSIIQLPENKGSAGGFHEAVKAAYEWGAEWIWFLDDDVVPRPDCLERLLAYSHISKCIHPNKKDIEGNEFMWESVYDPYMAKAVFLHNISFRNGKDFTFLNMGCFEGMLIHRDIVEKIGFPDERFFICGDDTIYGFLASLYTNVTFIRDAYIDKQFVFNNIAKPLFLYYFVRNQFLIKQHLKQYGFYRPDFFYLNICIFMISACTKHAIRGKTLKAPMYAWRGLIDGIRGKFYQLR